MKTTPLIIALLSIILLAVWGCRTSDQVICCDCGGSEYLVQVHMLVDTLSVLPNRTTYAEGWALVKNSAGAYMSGVPVSLGLESLVGWIEFTDLTLADTTDSLGRVDFRFCTQGQPGSTVIMAEIGSILDTWPLVISVVDSNSLDIRVDVAPDTIRSGPSVNDSSQVTVTATIGGRPVRTLQLALSATGGRLTPLDFTDGYGQAHAFYYPNSFGTFCIRCLNDSACVTVLDTTHEPLYRFGCRPL